MTCSIDYTFKCYKANQINFLQFQLLLVWAVGLVTQTIWSVAQTMWYAGSWIMLTYTSIAEAEPGNYRYCTDLHLSKMVLLNFLHILSTVLEIVSVLCHPSPIL